MKSLPPRFLGKTVIVTGASSGIGEGAAKRFLAEGANVTVCARSKSDLKKTYKDYSESRVLIMDIDVSSEADSKELIRETVKKFGQLDVLVNNAGIYVEGKLDEVTFKDWKKQMSVNVDGVYLCSHAAIPHLKKTKGCIINTASVSGMGGDYETAAYNASKGAVVNLTHAMAIDYGRDGIRVNSICPSLTESELTKDMLKDKKLVAEFKKRIPLNRVATPADIAGVYAFLASDDARFVTGVNLPVDGGVSASNGQPMY